MFKKIMEVLISALMLFNVNLGIIQINMSANAGNEVSVSIPGQSQIELKFKDVTVGSNSYAGLTENGDLYTWGGNYSCELGDGSEKGTSREYAVKIMENVKSIDGAATKGALTNDGKLYTWGKSGYGWLGNGSMDYNSCLNSPQLLMEDVASFDMGLCYVIKNDGSLWLWGDRNVYMATYSEYDQGHDFFIQPFCVMNNVKKFMRLGDNYGILTNDNKLYQLQFYYSNSEGFPRYFITPILDDVEDFKVHIYEASSGTSRNPGTKHCYVYTWLKTDGTLYSCRSEPIQISTGIYISSDEKWVKIANNINQIIDFQDALDAEGNLYTWIINEDGTFFLKPTITLHNVKSVANEFISYDTYPTIQIFALTKDNSLHKLQYSSSQYPYDSATGHYDYSIKLDAPKIISEEIVDGEVKKYLGLSYEGISDGIGSGDAYYYLDNDSHLFRVYKYDNEWHGEYVKAVENVEDYIVREVRKYTSDYEWRAYQQIASRSDMSYEAKQMAAQEIFNNTDIPTLNFYETANYFDNCSDYVKDYLFLTTDENFAAYNFFYWLNKTTAGKATRVSLVADDLLLKGEIVSYSNLITYVDTDYPGVKKHRALLNEFLIEQDSYKSVNTNAAKLGKFLKKLITLNEKAWDSYSDKRADEVFEILMNFESYPESIQESYAREFIDMCMYEQNIIVPLNDISECMGYTLPAMECIGATAEDVMSLFYMNEEIAVYQQNLDFLRTVAYSDIMTLEMRLAALELIETMESGYLKNVTDIMNNVFKLTVTETTLIVDFNAIKAIGSDVLGDVLLNVSIASFVTNLMIDIGDLTKDANETEGMAELGYLYSLKLKEDRLNFRKDPSEDNAWKFYTDYTYLLELRKMGEKKYMALSEVKAFGLKLKCKDYDEKKEYCDNNLKHLEEASFDLPYEYIPNNVKYYKKAVIHCPVSVEVYDSSNKKILTLNDGETSDITNKYGRFAVVENPINGEYEKVILQSTDAPLTYKLISKADGLVDVQISVCSSNITLTTNKETDTITGALSNVYNPLYTFDKLKVSKGDTITISDTEKYTLSDAEGNTTDYPFFVKDVETYTKVEEVKAESDFIVLKPGEIFAIGATVMPPSADNTYISWHSENEDIATVKNGVIKAVSTGKTKIILHAIDSSDENEAIESIDVWVANYGDVNLDGEFNVADVVLLQKWLLAVPGTHLTNWQSADLCEDGKLDVFDLVMMKCLLLNS